MLFISAFPKFLKTFFCLDYLYFFLGLYAFLMDLFELQQGPFSLLLLGLFSRDIAPPVQLSSFLT